MADKFVKKSENFSEWYTWICGENGAKLADLRYGVQGFIVHRPWAFKIFRKIYAALEHEVEKDGHEPLLFPTVIPEKYLVVEKEHAGFTPDVFWVTEQGVEKIEEKLALRPTGESAFYPMYSLWVRSHKELPLKLYQSRMTVFRNEKTTRPFLRGREFMFFETHNVYVSHKDALKQIESDMKIMQRVIYDQLFIPFIFFQRPQWDKFLGAEDTFTSDTIMPDGKRNQLSSTHDLGQRFAKAYNIRFTDADGTEQTAWQTCFGPGIWRIFAAMIGIHGDDNGLVIPFGYAPVQIVIIPVVFAKKADENKKVIEKCSEIIKELEKQGYSVKLDTDDETPGFKYNKWEMLGVPLRLEIGPREVEDNSATLVRRTDKEKFTINLKNLKDEIEKHSELLDREIKKKADLYFKNNTKEAKTYSELKKILEEHRGFVKAPFCSVEKEGAQCADKIKEDTSASVCGTMFGDDQVPDDKCIVCDKKAKHFVYIAKSI